MENQLTHLKEVRDLAIQLMEQHGLRPNQPGGWRFKWDRAKKRGGQCEHGKRVLSLSAPLHSMWKLEESRKTILHEIAHAHAGFEAHHNDEWKRWAIKVGADPVRCYPASRAAVPGRYEGTCPNGHKVQRHRWTKSMSGRSSCNRCSDSKKFDARYLITWRERI